MFRLIILVTRGILLESRVRRWTMFYILLGALVMVFAGSTFLAGSFSAVAFLVYWLVCAWLTLTALILALWDLLAVRAAGRRERLRLEKEAREKL